MHQRIISNWFIRFSLLCVWPGLVSAGDASQLIGYSEYRSNLPGGQHASFSTMQACIMQSDGSHRRVLLPELNEKPDSWTQFAGWSPDGKFAIIGHGWEDPENAKWEEEHQTFRFTKEGWLYDMYLLNIETDELTNLTAIDRVSFYNTGLFFWPDDPGKLGFQAMIGGKMHPFSMDRNGTNKQDLTGEQDGFAYGFSSSPDGQRVSYHKDYQIYLSDKDGDNQLKIETGNPFNFMPTWSPDGEWLLLLSGEHYNCHPFLVNREGTGLRKLADRNGYRGVTELLDIPAFHSASSDVPVWHPDSQKIYFTRKQGDKVELMSATLDGKTTQLTNSGAGVTNYHPVPAPDGQRVAFGSNRSGIRNQYVLELGTGKVKSLTNVPDGWGAVHLFWQPVSDESD